MRHLLLAALLATACSAAKEARAPVRPVAVSVPRADEPHLANLAQLTFGGENAEAYFSFDGRQLSLQARPTGEGCDRIYRMPLDTRQLLPVSSGKGATTCAYFLPGDRELIYASTDLAGDACPPRPDMSLGYVWALYDSYDLFRANADGSNLRRLTDTPGYDAEGTVCGKDGSIVFTSVRDGDIDLYRMDADGKNVRRLTEGVGYDGGAFFNADCTKLVWRASRPRKGKELDDYRALLAQHLVRPGKLELWVGNADGSEAHQVTLLDAASFAPFFFPDGRRIVFSSNYGDAKGREFDLFAIDEDGTHLERLTSAPGFDGFPIFSPDGRRLAFSSNRATPAGQHDTNVFLADWVDAPQKVIEQPADQVGRDVAWLADPAREGRGLGTKGLDAAADWLVQRFGELGLQPAGEDGFRQRFDAVVSVKRLPETALALLGRPVAESDFTPMGFSANGEVEGPAMDVGYGVVAPELKKDDYAGANVKGHVVVVRRFVHEEAAFEEPAKAKQYGDLRYKAWLARERGAKALVVVDLPMIPFPPKKDWRPPEEAPLPKLEPEGYGDVGIPVVVVKRDAAQALLAKLEHGPGAKVKVRVALEPVTAPAQNVVGRLVSTRPNKLPGVVVVGAHYDHLGMGGRYSLAPEKHEAHVGADDNASGVAGMLEVARALAARRAELGRDVVFAAFSGEELGTLGSSHLTKHPPPGLAMPDVVAMLNLDMVGRLRGNRLTVLGAESAEEWKGLLAPSCEAERLDCGASGDGYGPSDQTPFYAAGVPVLHFFTGAHGDYHKPSDTADRIDKTGVVQVARLVAATASDVAGRKDRLTYRRVPTPAGRGDVRSFNASLGSVPDYAGPPGGQKGVLLAGVRPGGAAELAGIRRGDILVRLGTHDVGSVEDLMYALNASHPGETVTAVVLRDGREVKLEVTLQEGRRR